MLCAMLRNDYKSERHMNRFLPGKKRAYHFRWAMATSLLGILILALSLAPESAKRAKASAPTRIATATQNHAALTQRRHPLTLSLDPRRTIPPLSAVATQSQRSPNPQRALTHLSPTPTNSPRPQAATMPRSDPRQELALTLTPWINADTRVDQRNIPQIRRVKIRTGDSLARVFQREHIPAAVLQNIVALGKPARPLTRIMPGKHLQLRFLDGKFVGLDYELGRFKTFQLRRNEGTFKVSTRSMELESELHAAHGVIRDSLYNAGKHAGISDNLIMQLANIFGWDIDFALDIRKGDTFSLVYERRFADGEYVGEGEIIAAEFVNQGKTFRAVRYVNKAHIGHYYTPQGLSMRKEFLRTPLNFLYISSQFQRRRFHPILKRFKAHHGIDYAAPVGTPVWAAGDGRVTRSGYNRFNGNYVFIRHDEKYTTKYLHLSKRRVHVGQRVKQHQIIGNVGMTGLATGPHLHYEFLVNSVHRNPRTVPLPKATPVAKAELARFMSQVKPRIAALDLQTRLRLARAATITATANTTTAE